MVRHSGIKPTPGDRVFDSFNLLFMLGLIVVMLYPMLNVLAVSLSSPSNIQKGLVNWLPKDLNTDGYRYVLTQPWLMIGYRNSVLYALGSVICVLVLTSLVAYPLTYNKFPLKKFITFYLAITMFVGGGLIPTYLLMKSIGLYNNPLALILPGSVGAGTVFVFRTFMQNLPGDMRESAYMDGANDFTIWWRIYIPLSKPLFATYGLFTAVGSWNSWFGALLYIQDEKMYPIQLYLRRIVVQQSVGSIKSDFGAMLVEGRVSPENIQMATIIVVMLPILFIYPFVQKYFIKGVMIGAIKG